MLHYEVRKRPCDVPSPTRSIAGSAVEHEWWKKFGEGSDEEHVVAGEIA